MPGQDAGLLHVLSPVECRGIYICAAARADVEYIYCYQQGETVVAVLLFNAIVSTLLVLSCCSIPTMIRVKMYIVVGVSTILSIIRALTFLPLYGAACLHFKWYTFYPVILRNIAVVAVVTLVCFGDQADLAK